MSGNIAGKVIVLTGASSGLGEAAARRLTAASSQAANLCFDEVQFAVMWPASITCFQRADSSFMNWANCSGVSAIMS